MGYEEVAECIKSGVQSERQAEFANKTMKNYDIRIRTLRDDVHSITSTIQSLREKLDEIGDNYKDKMKQLDKKSKDMKKELAELLQKFMITGQMLSKHREEEEIFMGLIGQGEERVKSHQSREMVRKVKVSE